MSYDPNLFKLRWEETRICDLPNSDSPTTYKQERGYAKLGWDCIKVSRFGNWERKRIRKFVKDHAYHAYNSIGRAEEKDPPAKQGVPHVYGWEREIPVDYFMLVFLHPSLTSEFIALLESFPARDRVFLGDKSDLSKEAERMLRRFNYRRIYRFGKHQDIVSIAGMDQSAFTKLMLVK